MTTRSRRTSAAILALSLALLLAGCGSEDRPLAPAPSPDSEVRKEDVSGASAGFATEEGLEALRRIQASVDALQRELAPPKGTPRSDVARRFGSGRAAKGQKGYPNGPPDSPLRLYALELGSEARAPKASLVVYYDPEWAVKRAFFQNPHGTRGDLFYPAGRLPREVLERRVREAQSMVEHLGHVRTALEGRDAPR